MLLFLPQRLFQSVSIWFVDFVGDVFADPGATLVQLEWCILLRHLLHANQYLHEGSSALLQTDEYKWAGLSPAKNNRAASLDASGPIASNGWFEMVISGRGPWSSSPSVLRPKNPTSSAHSFRAASEHWCW